MLDGCLYENFKFGYLTILYIVFLSEFRKKVKKSVGYPS